MCVYCVQIFMHVCTCMWKPENKLRCDSNTEEREVRGPREAGGSTHMSGQAHLHS